MSVAGIGGQGAIPGSLVEGGVQATVTVGDVDDLAVINESANNDNDIVTDYMIFNKYEWNPHRYMTGLTTPGTFQGKSVSFFQLANPTLLWICRWTACKTNEQPQIPDPKSVGEDWTILDIMPELASVGLMPDGITPLYRISGTYVYGHNNPSQEVYEDVSFPRNVWIEDVFDRTFPLENLVPDLIGKSGSSSSGNSQFPGGKFVVQ